MKKDFDEKFTLPSGATCMYPKVSGVASEDINCRCYCEYKTVVISDDLGYNDTEEYLQEKLDFIDFYTNEKSFIPKGAKFKYTKTIASDEEIRVINKLRKEYNSKGHWEKKVGQIESAKYIHDVHWYENNNKQYKIKMKYRKEK